MFFKALQSSSAKSFIPKSAKLLYSGGRHLTMITARKPLLPRNFRIQEEDKGKGIF